MIEPKFLRCEYLINPLGIDVTNPRLSWVLESKERNQKQTAYHILVASNEELLKKNNGDLWDSKKTESDQSIHIVYNGKSLKSQMFCYWKVRVWDRDGNPSEWSEPAMWSMGLLEPSDWKAKWIGAPPKSALRIKKLLPKKYYPSPLLRKSFSIAGKIKRAIIYATALGEYELYLNGKRIEDHIFAPEWTDYKKRIQCQTYDITNLLERGENVIGATLADGWYAGNLGPGFPYPKHSFYGVNRRLLLQLMIELSDGTLKEVISDKDWKILVEGPIEKADHFMGEVYNAQKEQAGWDKPGYDDSNWELVTVDNSIQAHLFAQMNEPIRIVREIKPVAITEPKPGVFIFNLGQNIAGWCKVRLGGSTCEADATITLRHGERLKPDGSLYTKNLRRAKATDKFILNGLEEREFHPHFTYHGFQYVEVKGLKPGATPDLDMITGCAIASDPPMVGAFESSDSTLNKLWGNIIWTQRDNMISVPTDCPQRNERMGWMGDVTAFNQTSILNMDMAAFYSKWIRDMRDAQAKNGRYPDIVPYAITKWEPVRLKGAPAWTDCGIILPWNVYLNYGDKRLIEQHYHSAKKLVDFIHSKNPNLIRTKAVGIIPLANFGDWLNGNTIKVKGYPRKGASVPKDVFGTAFFARCTEILSKMAGVLGLTDEITYYGDLANKIKDRFNEEFVTEDGIIKGDTQAGYAIALHFNLIPENLRSLAVTNLLKAFARYDGRISTGFCSTLPLMLELTWEGLNDLAYQLILSRRFPSWFYMIDQGATTMWERWDSYIPERGFQSSFMTSFNHFAFGSVGEWIYKVILGINLDETQPGYKHTIIKPQPGGTLTWAKGHYNSIHGKIAVNWSLKEDNYNLEVAIPANTTATVHILTADPQTITEGGNPIQESEEIQFQGFEDDFATYQITSGNYEFKSKIPP